MRRLVPVVAAALALAGCVDLAPRYHRPASPAPASFPTGPAYAPQSDRAAVAWRDFFSDPRLVQLIDLALKQNRDLRIAMANIAVARAQYHVQRSALFPTVNAQIGAVYGQEPSSAVAAGAVTPGTSSTFNERLYNAGVGVSAWQVDLFGKVRNLTRAAQDQYFSQVAARDAAQITLVEEVAVDYVTLASDQSLLAIARETLASGQASLDLTRKRLDAGVASGLDVASAQTTVQQAAADEARLISQVAEDRNALDLVVGAAAPDDLLPNGLGADVVVLDRLPGAVSSHVLLARPDVIQAEDVLRAANANIGAARAAFFPNLSLTGSGGFTSLALSTLFKASSATWSFAPTLSQTLFDGGANAGNLALAKAQRDLEIAQYEKSIETAFREVADALAVRGQIDRQVTAQEGLVAANAQALALAQARYEQGADTYLNVLIAQRSLYAARQSLVAAQLARKTNLVTLYAVLGGGLDHAAAS
jgi:multidrug efflux system outer membrane protein